MQLITLFFLFLAFCAFCLARNAYRPGIMHIPGPWLAKFTNLWRLIESIRGTYQDRIPELHKKYNSSLVRIGPNILSINDPTAIDALYGFKSDMEKSDMTKPVQPILRGKQLPTMFAAQDRKTHSMLRKPVAGTYSTSNVLGFEPYVNETMRYFFQRVDELFIQTKKPCDIDNWIQYFAYDTVTEMTMSRPQGFLKTGGDVNGILKALQREMDYRGVTMAMPVLDDIIRRNPINAYIMPRRTGHFSAHAKKILDDRLAEKETDFAEFEDSPWKKRDFVSRFLEARAKDPEKISQGMLVGYLQTNLVAGSDTTTIVLRTALYNIMRSQTIFDTMRKELDAANVSYPITYTTAFYELPYCAAVIKESLRIHFPITGIMERLVPESGLVLPDGTTFPPGTVIGMMPDLIGRDKGIFGEDAEDFNPNRWLKGPNESDEDYQPRLRAMKAADLSFGFGPRACLGKHVAEMLLYKTIPTIVGLLDFKLTDPSKPWKLRKLFFVKQSGMDSDMQWREGRSMADLRE